MLRLFVSSLFIFFLYACPNSSHTQETSPYRDPIVIQVIHLDYANAEYLASVLAPLLSKQGRVVAYSPTNSLIIKDRASIVKRLVKIIKGKPAPYK
jgi:general secretion pathway protein D